MRAPQAVEQTDYSGVTKDLLEKRVVSGMRHVVSVIARLSFLLIGTLIPRLSFIALRAQRMASCQ